MTPEEFKKRLGAEAAFQHMMGAQGATQAPPPDVDSLRGVLMMAVQMSRAMQLPLADLQALVADEAAQWEKYVETKARVIARRKEQAKGGAK